MAPSAACTTWKTAPVKDAVWSWPVGPMLIRVTVPFVASTVEPKGIWPPATSGCPFTSTVPLNGAMSKLCPRTGGGGGAGWPDPCRSS